ncbi:MAG: hypothetical protein P8H54_00980 [Flavobacteriaceae bacterium]|jgi:hypothetical protein|nr:hypothetical protein [Flavobacteriaceae bacterium]MDG1759220.1 hypothetical protein [Flavobacteriaceae bacterium]|tara:strand:+ start:151 stop:570 length:420 start_codon:yes stop_codon:yes gene_type:complete
MDIKLRYNIKNQRYYIIAGGLFILLAGIELIASNEIRYFNITLALLYIAPYFYHKKVPFLTIQKGVFKQNWWFGKSIDSKDINEIKYFAGEYIIRSQKKELRIDTHIIDPRDQPLLTDFLRTHQDKWVNAMPFEQSQKG